MIGKLVRYRDKAVPRSDKRNFFGIGVVLDYRHIGRFYPSIELKVHFPNSKDPHRTIMNPDIKQVEFLDEEQNEFLRR